MIVERLVTEAVPKIVDMVRERIEEIEVSRPVPPKLINAATAAVQTGTIAGPYRPEEFSVFALARRDGGRIAGLMIAHACDGDGWERTNLRSVISVDLATRLGEVAETEVMK